MAPAVSHCLPWRLGSGHRRRRLERTTRARGALLALLGCALVGLSAGPQAASAAGEKSPLDVLWITVPTVPESDPQQSVEGKVQVITKDRVKPEHLNGDGSLNLANLAELANTTPASNIKIKVRGSSSRAAPKKNYTLKLNGALLGMATGKDWVLHACYADMTCLRNVLTYSLGRQVMTWAPDTRFAEVVFVEKSGAPVYWGLYVAIEKIDLDRLKTGTRDITGSYIFKREGRDHEQELRERTEPPFAGWPSKLYGSDPEAPLLWTAQDPEPLSLGQRDYLKKLMDGIEARFEDAAWKAGNKDPWDVLDQRSWVEFTLIQELANNIDGYWKSMHLTKFSESGGGKLNMGPIWDFDLAEANADFVGGCRTDIWQWERSVNFKAFERLWTTPRFGRALRHRWQELRNSAVIGRTRIREQLDAWARDIKDARVRDNLRWDTLGKDPAQWSPRPGEQKRAFEPCRVEKGYPGDAEKTYLGEVEFLKDWVRDRITWMDVNLPTIATELNVTSTTDAVDADPGDGICATADGVCSLRAAVQEANELPLHQRIVVPPGTYELSIPPEGQEDYPYAASGDLDLRGDVTVAGTDAGSVVVDGNKRSRVFDVAPGVTAAISGLTIRHGKDLGGGGVAVTSASLTLDKVFVAENESEVAGGGVGVSGLNSKLVITSSIVLNNRASFLGGDGGGIDADGEITIDRSHIAQNVASGAGGGLRASGAVSVTRSSIARNEASGFFGNGGGISALGLSLVQSTVSGNTAATQGGGVFASGSIVNSTISGNASGTRGGGASTSGSLSLLHVTVANNKATGGGRGLFRFGGSSELSLRNTILADPPGPECVGLAPRSRGSNIASDASCALTAGGDKPARNALIAPLGDYGGRTQTHLLISGSPAINAATVGLTVDQRGVKRPLGPAPDIGAVEGISRGP